MTLSFAEDLDAFFDTPGFTVPVVSSSVTSVGYFESPDEIVADGVLLTTDFSVLVKTSDFSPVASGCICYCPRGDCWCRHQDL